MHFSLPMCSSPPSQRSFCVPLACRSGRHSLVELVGGTPLDSLACDKSYGLGALCLVPFPAQQHSAGSSTSRRQQQCHKQARRRPRGRRSMPVLWPAGPLLLLQAAASFLTPCAHTQASTQQSKDGLPPHKHNIHRPSVARACANIYRHVQFVGFFSVPPWANVLSSPLKSTYAHTTPPHHTTHSTTTSTAPRKQRQGHQPQGKDQDKYPLNRRQDF